MPIFVCECVKYMYMITPFPERYAELFLLAFDVL